MIHNRKYFYKYVTAETALLILQNRKLKYSSPILFNDPFDTQTRVSLDCEESEFMKAFIDELYRLAHDEREPIFVGSTNSLCRDILRVRQIVKDSSRKLPKELFEEISAPILKLLIKFCEDDIERMNIWWSKVVRASRVFCVAETHDNLLMWAHYTNDHTGAVIEFECLPELDNPLCAARKVDYVAKPPVMGKLNEFLRYVTGQSLLNHKLSIYDLFLSKSEHWKYEQEWRVFIPPADMDSPAIPKDADGNEILFDLLSVYHPKEIRSIYLGCKMDQKIRPKILSCLTGDFGHVRKYHCIRNEREYKLDFQEIIM